VWTGCTCFRQGPVTGFCKHDNELDLKIQVELFWIVMPRTIAVGFQRFGNIAAVISSCRWTQQDPSKHCYPTATVRGVTAQKTST
jgi:hypothetical protein